VICVKIHNGQEMITEQLSKKARENIERNEAIRRQDSIFVKMLPGEEIILKFDPEEIKLIETSFAGIKSRKLQYGVFDAENKRRRYWTVNHKTSAVIDSYLVKGYSLLKVKRIGLELQTKYQVSIP
jgi:hypothetical protein